MQHPLWSGRTRTCQPNGPANFALGSASSQLQEVLVTDLPRSFNRGERETREGGGRERGRDEREKGRERGRIEKGQVFQLSLQHLNDPSGSGCVLSKKLNKNITHCTHLYSLSPPFGCFQLPLYPVISLYMFPSRC